MILNNPKDEKQLRENAEISVNILQEVGESIKPGISTLELERKADVLCKRYGVQPAFKRVDGYSFATCISVNDVAVHGIPNERVLKKGDLVSIDFGIFNKGLYTDHCWTWSIGKPNEKNLKLLLAGRGAVENAVSKAIVGNHIGDISFEMENAAKKNGFNVLKMFVGHGIGKTLHDRPDVPAYGHKVSGELLVDGMVLCIECQVVDDSSEVVIDNDGWSAKTEHGGNSVMFEYMVIVRKNEPDILTDTLDWDIVA